MFAENAMRVPAGTITVVYSPDDGGYYLEHFDIERERTRVSKKIYATRAEAIRALESGKVQSER
jgi:hypothetical protein